MDAHWRMWAHHMAMAEHTSSLEKLLQCLDIPYSQDVAGTYKLPTKMMPATQEFPRNMLKI